jgi:hypothetical protein
VGPGLYDFNLNQDKLRVFDGEAVVEDGGSPVKVDSGHETALDFSVATSGSWFHPDGL